MPGRKPGWAFDVEKLQTLVAEGRTIADIADEMGVTARTVSRHKRALGIAHSPRPVRPVEEWGPTAERLFAEGYSQRAVAEITGTNWWNLQRHFPGKAWTRSEAGQYAVAVRRLNRLSNFPEREPRYQH